MDWKKCGISSQHKQPRADSDQLLNLPYCGSDDIQLRLEPTSKMPSHVNSNDHNGILEQKSKKWYTITYTIPCIKNINKLNAIKNSLGKRLH